uniref:Uncharacterized protein n=1 Tax=Panagrolaimus sp. ES5 TaxID=591445 RepID=A0AC34GWT4_9BILA
MVHPTNHLNIKPETLALLHQNPAFRKARKEAKEVTVGRLPYGYEPIRCKPPYCNPFVHYTAVGVEVEQGDDTFMIGGLDFPLPVGTNGAGVRVPFSGALEQGTSPYAYAHGNAYNPVSPFDFNKLDNVKTSKKVVVTNKEKRRAPLLPKVYDSSDETNM